MNKTKNKLNDDNNLIFFVISVRDICEADKMVERYFEKTDKLMQKYRDELEGKPQMYQRVGFLCSIV